MRRPRLAPPGRIPASEKSPAQKAASQRGHLIRFYGDLGEAAFLHKATSLGFMVARPWRNIYGYDFIVEGGHNLLRLQVKTTSSISDGSYRVCVRRTTRTSTLAYNESEVDFIAVYIIPEDTWYILPVREVVNHQALRFRPKGHRRPGPYDHYREAWHLLREPDGLVFG